MPGTRMPFSRNLNPKTANTSSPRRFDGWAAILPVFLWLMELFCGFPFSVPGFAWAAQGNVSVRSVAEKESVAVGEPFAFQIRLEGSDIAPGAAQPDMSGITDFSVEFLGGQSNNSSSITIVNGKMTRVESNGYVYSYRLTPRRTGKLEIPAIAVPIDAGRTNVLRTQPVSINVTEPETTEDFHLELKFSKTNFYVGEPVVLTLIWYLGKDVESVTFNLPFLKDESFAFIDPKVDQKPGKQYFQIEAGGTRVIAERGTAVHNGREFTTLSFSKVLLAKRPGVYVAPESTVSCRALVGYSRRQQGRSPFDNFFDDDFFNPAKRGIYKTFVSCAAPLRLTVLALPEEGRPPGFTGLVGHFQVEASATPLDVNIGDPITLEISVSGGPYLDNVTIPPLANAPEFEKDFKIPEEMASGTTQGNARLFSQTLRPKSADVKTIPSIEIPFFNPDSARYETARTRPISLMVKPAKVLTSADVEGKPQETAHKKSELENWSQGIAYNYEGPEVLEQQVYRISSIVRSPLWLATVLAPVLVFLALLAFTTVRQRRLADPDRLKSRKALARFKKRVAAIGGDRIESGDAFSDLLAAVRTYLGDKLGRNSSALTFADVEEKLKEMGANSALLERLKDLFRACEEGTYGSASPGRPADALLEEAVEAIGTLDREV